METGWLDSLIHAHVKPNYKNRVEEATEAAKLYQQDIDQCSRFAQYQV
ncbi:MAG: hypothetical protein M3Q16_06150 [Pseudomonadota bacterium]|nr:hypothetical protein [Pseudomonadota bacterium]